MHHAQAERERLLEAAILLIQEGVADRFTVEGVADAAGVPLDQARAHFPSVNDLAVAIAQHGYAAHKAMIEDAMGTDESPGAYLRGYIASAFPSESSGKPNLAPVLASILRSVPFDYDGLSRVRRHHAEEDATIVADGIDPVLARIIRFAVDGLYMNDVFGMCALTPEERGAILDRLRAMSERKD